ncbi:uncharacterized protein K444DRAFT_537190, partial [Hyaloscypha bicolor E]
SLDGGGIRGISILVVLEEVLHRLQQAENLSSVPVPPDYFDFICGTSHLIIGATHQTAGSTPIQNAYSGFGG